MSARTRKSTRRWTARRAINAEVRQYIKAALAQYATTYGTLEYDTAKWKSDYFYGRAFGAITMAKELGALEYGGLSESFRLEKRLRRVDDALADRRKTQAKPPCIAVLGEIK